MSVRIMLPDILITSQHSVTIVTMIWTISSNMFICSGMKNMLICSNYQELGHVNSAYNYSCIPWKLLPPLYIMKVYNF